MYNNVDIEDICIFIILFVVPWHFYFKKFYTFLLILYYKILMAFQWRQLLKCLCWVESLPFSWDIARIVPIDNVKDITFFFKSHL